MPKTMTHGELYRRLSTIRRTMQDTLEEQGRSLAVQPWKPWLNATGRAVLLADPHEALEAFREATRFLVSRAPDFPRRRGLIQLASDLLAGAVGTGPLQITKPAADPPAPRFQVEKNPAGTFSVLDARSGYETGRWELEAAAEAQAQALNDGSSIGVSVDVGGEVCRHARANRLLRENEDGTFSVVEGNEEVSTWGTKVEAEMMLEGLAKGWTFGRVVAAVTGRTKTLAEDERARELRDKADRRSPYDAVNALADLLRACSAIALREDVKLWGVLKALDPKAIEQLEAAMINAHEVLGGPLGRVRGEVLPPATVDLDGIRLARYDEQEGDVLNLADATGRFLVDLKESFKGTCRDELAQLFPSLGDLKSAHAAVERHRA